MTVVAFILVLSYCVVHNESGIIKEVLASQSRIRPVLSWLVAYLLSRDAHSTLRRKERNYKHNFLQVLDS
jgi:hypothetical protein